MPSNCVIVLLFIASNLAYGADIEIKREGVAKALDGEKILYFENHQIVSDSAGLNRKITTTYKRPSGQVIAHMVSDFKDSKVVADVTFEDFRFSTVYQQSVDIEKKMVNLSLTNPDGKVENQKTELTDDMIAGQGFDNYAKLNLTLEKKQIVRFLVLNKLDYFTFEISPLEPLVKNQKQFRLNINSMILKYIVGAIDVVYDLQDKMLLSYKGISNLVSDSKDSQDVSITYQSVENFNEKTSK